MGGHRAVTPDLADQSPAGGEPDVARPVRYETGYRVTLRYRRGQVGVLGYCQSPFTRGVAIVRNPQQPALPVDDHQAVLVVEIGVHATQQAALGEAHLRGCRTDGPFRGIEQVDG